MSSCLGNDANTCDRQIHCTRQMHPNRRWKQIGGREGERERDASATTSKQPPTSTKTNKQPQTNTTANKHAKRVEANRATGRSGNKQTDKHQDKQGHRQAGTQTHMQTNTQASATANKQPHWQTTDTYNPPHTHIHNRRGMCNCLLGRGMGNRNRKIIV